MEFDNYLSFFLKGRRRELLHDCHFGIERETLRLNSRGKISHTSHPSELGSPLTHPYIGTDYGEAQLEWNTPPFTTFSAAERFLQYLMVFTQKEIKKTLFWPYSMPGSLTSQIAIAKYGSSHQAKEKEIYRAGLKCRYGQNLQMISGIHFNFSLSKSFWEHLHQFFKFHESLSSFINFSYLKMIRNYLREGWLLTYLFGATPAIDASYLKTIPKKMKSHLNRTFFGEHATSIRMSHYGYYSRIQNQLAISFNDLESYISDMEYALATPKEEYRRIDTQLNDHILQIANEHYSRIRPKCIPYKNETPIDAIRNRGIEYLEIRTLDIDPYLPIGIGREKLSFLHLFLLYCLFLKGCRFDKEAQHCLTCNQDNVALYGRNPKILLKDCKRKRSLQSWGNHILSKMEPIAALLGPTYLNTLYLQKQKLENPEMTLSGRILGDLKQNQYEITSFGLRYARKHNKTLAHKKIPKKIEDRLKKLVIESRAQTQALESASEVLVPGYENLELSTQILIREAKKQGIAIEVLDPKDSFLRLQKGKIVEYVKQATKTSKDSYVVSNVLKNKHVTKKLLERKRVSVPEGGFYTSLDEAKIAYPLFAKKKVVVKPNSTNFGIGVSFIDPGKKKNYIFALKKALQHASSVLVEEFCKGEEYRFLIVKNKVIGVARREPAHVIGDGIHTIKQLIHQKNHDPSYFRYPKTHLCLGVEEKTNLCSQSLTPNSIPKKGKRVCLRQNSNVSTGGDAIDVTDEIQAGYKQIALKATRIVGAQVCGVDMMIQFPKKIPTSKNHTIIELNHNPVLYIHAFPYKGKKRNVAKPLLDLMGF